MWVVHRTPEMLNIIDSKVDYLADPESSSEMQPIYAQNKYRSVKPNFWYSRCMYSPWMFTTLQTRRE